MFSGIHTCLFLCFTMPLLAGGNCRFIDGMGNRITFGPTYHQGMAHTMALSVTKSTGQIYWQQTLMGNHNLTATDVLATEKGVVVMGSFTGELQMPGQTLTASNEALFLIWYGLDGTLQNALLITSQEDLEGVALVAREQGLMILGKMNQELFVLPLPGRNSETFLPGLGLDIVWSWFGLSQTQYGGGETISQSGSTSEEPVETGPTTPSSPTT